MKPQLPSHPNWEFYQKRAKQLLKAYRNREESALLRIGRSRDGRETCLADAQRTVAREIGFANWAALRQAVLARQPAAPSRDQSLQNPLENDSNSQTRPDLDEDRESADSGRSEVKQRYESDPSVQRWLSEQREVEGFASAFLSNHRERDWILSSLGQFHSEGTITDVVGAVKSGKEATVYCCSTPLSEKFLAAKVYRPRMFRNLQNDVSYRENRHSVYDRRTRKAMRKKTRQGKVFRMESWIQFEYDTLSRLWEGGASVPKPISRQGNAILMEFIGDASGAAPLLHSVKPEKPHAEVLFEQILNDIRTMLAADRIHGDLSPYNILYWQGSAWLIDFAQSVDAHSGPEAFGFLHRDIGKITEYFTNFGIRADSQEIAIDLWMRYERGRL